MLSEKDLSLDEFAEMIGMILKGEDVKADEVEVEVDDNTIIRKINLAGISKKDIQVSVVPKRIVVGVDNSVHTTIVLEDGIDPEKIKANHKNGMLIIKYPAHPEPFKVEVK